MKLLYREPESDALRAALVEWGELATSVIGDIEVRRVAARLGTTAEAVLNPVTVVQLDDDVRLLAASVGSPALRSLDAIHLATALSLADDLGAFCCYDRRLAADAESAGLTVLSPGLD